VSHPGPAFRAPTELDGPRTVATPAVPLPRPAPPPEFLGPPDPPAPAAPGPPPSTVDRHPARGPALTAAALAAVLLAGGIGGAVGAGLGPGGSIAPPVSAATPAGPLDTAAAAVLPSVVSVEVTGARGAGTGSGFVIDADGHILTNAHVVASGGDVRVVYSDGRRESARVVGTDPATDVAVLQVNPAGVPPALTLRTPDDLRVGETVLAVGSPLGLSGTVTAGIVSAVDRLTGIGDERNRQGVIQTDAPINPGNSGGPLVDTAGRVVGMNTAIASLGPGNIGIGFAIPADRAADVAEQIIAG
jgi:putative serine protease PepD